MTTVIPRKREPSAEVEAAVARWCGDEVVPPRLDGDVRVRVDSEQVRRALRALTGGTA